MTLIRIVAVAICVFNFLPSCHAEFNNSTSVSRRLRGFGNSKAFALQQKETTNVTSPERSLQARAPLSFKAKMTSAWSEMAEMEDNLGIVGSSLGALSTLLAMDNPSLENVAIGLGTVALDVLSEVNPIAGAVATFFFGLIVGSSDEGESEAQQLYKIVLEKANEYTDDAIFKERLRKCCSPGTGLSHELETLLRGKRSWENERVFLNDRYNNIRSMRGDVFGECIGGNNADGCRSWQQKGGAVALIAGLSLATTEIALLEQISIISDDKSVTEQNRQWIAADAAEYVSLLINHYAEYKAYRLSQVQSVEGKLITLGHRPHVGTLMRWEMNDKDKSLDRSYADTCALTSGSVSSCVGCDRTRAECVTFQTCCAGNKPCIVDEYEKCKLKYKDNLSVDMEEKLKARIDQFAKAVEPVIGEVVVVPDPGDSKDCDDFKSYEEAKAWYDTYFPLYGDVAKLDDDHDGEPCEAFKGKPNPGDSKDCDDFKSYDEAKAWYDFYFPLYGDVAKLDGDDDGEPCEALKKLRSSPGDSKNCGDFSTWKEAKAWYDFYFPLYGDVAKLDGDDDGVPCEALKERDFRIRQNENRSDDRLQAQLVQFLEPEVGVDLQVEKFMPGVGVARVRDITVSPRTRIAFNFEAGKHPR